jgi:D-glycero-D-manno-heptose 1,7-bisphosphate phosphatase
VTGALFLDRDGVINQDCAYCYRPDQFIWIPGVFETVRTARGLGLRVVVVTNQAGIARGYYSEDDFLRLTEWMLARFEAEQADIDAVYFCPYHVEGRPPYNHDSEMRKPRPGMLLQAAREHRLTLSESLLIGDQETDIAAGRAAGLKRTALLSARRPAASGADDVLESHAAAIDWLRRWTPTADASAAR